MVCMLYSLSCAVGLADNSPSPARLLAPVSGHLVASLSLQMQRLTSRGLGSLDHHGSHRVRTMRLQHFLEDSHLVIVGRYRLAEELIVARTKGGEHSRRTRQRLIHQSVNALRQRLDLTHRIFGDLLELVMRLLKSIEALLHRRRQLIVELILFTGAESLCEFVTAF